MEHTDADCKTLQTTTKATYTKASDAAKAAGKKYKACTTATYKPVKTADELAAFCKADKDAQTAPDARKAQVKVWVDNVDAALTNSWTGDSEQPQHELWMQWSFKDAVLESDAAAIQTKIEGWHTTAKANVATTESKVKSTAATEKSDKAKVASTAAAETTAGDKVTSTKAAEKAADAAKKAAATKAATDA